MPVLLDATLAGRRCGDIVDSLSETDRAAQLILQ